MRGTYPQLRKQKTRGPRKVIVFWQIYILQTPTLHTNLFTILTCAQRTRVHFCPQHWLLCHLGL